jgi:hypothetical protein
VVRRPRRCMHVEELAAREAPRLGVSKPARIIQTMRAYDFALVCFWFCTGCDSGLEDFGATGGASTSSSTVSSGGADSTTGGAVASGGDGAGAASSVGGAGGGGTGGSAPCDRSTYAKLIVCDGPIGYWRLGEAGTVKADSSGQNRNAQSIFSGGNERQVQGAIDGDSDQAAELTTGARIKFTTGTTDALHFGGAAPFTVEGWVAYVGTGIDSGIDLASCWYNQGKGYRFSIGAGMLGLTRYTTAGTDPMVSYVGGTNEFSPIAPLFTYVAATFDGVNWRLYSNGSLAGVPYTNNASIQPAADEDFLVASPNSMTEARFDEIAIYPRALSGAEIKAHYDCGKDVGMCQ